MTTDSDQLEPDNSAGAGQAEHQALNRAHVIVEHGHHPSDQYEMHDHQPLLPGQILTETIARLRFTIVMVGFFYTGLGLVLVIAAICLIAPNLIFMLNQTSPILLHTARIIISLVALGLGLACIAVMIKQRELTGKLALAEMMIDNIRDVALIQMQATRYSMEELTEKLKFNEHHHPSPFDYIDLAKRIGPLVSLLMAKERSIMTLAVEGIKLFQVVKKVLHK